MTTPKLDAPATSPASNGSVCKCADCGKEITARIIQLCEVCYARRCDEADMQSDEDTTCERCNGEGEIMVCIDDICHGIGECIHGDGYRPCPSCKGSGETPRQTPNDQAKP